MNNAQFRLMCEGMGLYTAKHVKQAADTVMQGAYITPERQADYWLKGTASGGYDIPAKVVGAFLALKERHEALVLAQRINPTIQVIYKQEENLWSEWPDLQGLPVSFYNQVVIGSGIREIQYFEALQT